MEDSERRKVAELLKEMRKEGDKSSEEKNSLGWMYKGSSDLIDREEYLLGKSIDKSFEVLNNASSSNECLGRTSEQSNVPKKLLERTDCSDQIDLTNKMMDDPLYAIKEKEMEARRKLLSNPVKLKQIKQMLLEKHKNNSSHKEEKKRKKKKKLSSEELNQLLIKKLKKFNDKEKRKALKKVMKPDSDSDSSSSESSSDEDDDKRSHHVKRKKKREKSSSSESQSSSSSGKSKKIKKLKKKRRKSHSDSRKRKKKQDVEDSSSSESVSSDNEKKRKHRKKKVSKSLKTSKHKRTKKSSSSSSSSSTSSSSSSSDEESSDDSEEIKKSKKMNEKRKRTSSDTKSKHHDRDLDDSKKIDRTSSKRRRDDEHDSSKRLKEDRRKRDSSDDSVKAKKSYGLMVPEGTKPISNRPSNVKKYEKTVEPKTKYVPQPKPKHLSEKEKAEKIKEMMEDAKRRKKDRETNLANHKKAVSEEESIKTYDDDFMRRQMSKMGGTMADRIKSNINNIQRSKSSMDNSFVRK